MKSIIVLLLSLSFITGCTCHDESCTLHTDPVVRLAGFDSTELSRVIVRRWDTSGFYTRLADTSIQHAYKKGVPGAGYISPRGLWYGYNIEIVFPDIPRTIRLYNFKYEMLSQQVCPGFNKKELLCENPLKTYMQEGVLVNYNENTGTITITR